MKKIIPLLAGIFFAMYAQNNKMPRGYRNKNPGNLKLSNIQWDGKISKSANNDGVFEQFTSDFYGIRAAALDLYHDITNKNQNTIRKLIYAYAPPSENKTNAYIASVSKSTGIYPDSKLVPNTRTLLALLKAIFKHENGFNKYTDMQIIASIDAGVGKKYGIN